MERMPGACPPLRTCSSARGISLAAFTADLIRSLQNYDSSRRAGYWRVVPSSIIDRPGLYSLSLPTRLGGQHGAYPRWTIAKTTAELAHRLNAQHRIEPAHRLCRLPDATLTDSLIAGPKSNDCIQGRHPARANAVAVRTLRRRRCSRHASSNQRATAFDRRSRASVAPRGAAGYCHAGCCRLGLLPPRPPVLGALPKQQSVCGNHSKATVGSITSSVE
jgi:hypothetical protein